MRVRALVLVTSVALWSCDHKPDEPSKSATTSIEQPPAAPAKPPDAIVKAVAVRPLSELLSAKRPVLPDPLPRLRFGMSIEDAKKAAPEIFVEGWDSSFRTWLKSAEFPGVAFGISTDREGKTVERLRVQLPKDQARSLATAAWGAPQEGKNGGNVQLVWFNPADGIRAVLDDDTIDFTPYLPAAKLFGSDPDRFGFEIKPLIGMTVADLKTTFPGQIEDDKWLVLPSTEMEWGFTRIILNFTADHVSDWWFSIHYNDADAGKNLRLIFDKKWGAPKKWKRLKYDTLMYHASPRVDAEDVIGGADYAGYWEIRVGGTGEQLAH